MGVTYLIIRIQGSLPLNPQHLGAVPPALSFNTAASFMTNTNWQNYGGETTMSYFSQIGALTLEQFLSPAIGIAVAIALVRGFARRNSPTIGNFWVDMTRCMLYIVLPIAFVAGIIFVGQGAVQTLAGPVSIHDSLNGVSQTIPRGPIGFMEAIKQLGNNGGGFLNANSATTFENPTALTNWLSIYLLLAIPFALTYTFGKMVGSVRHGAALLAAMVIIFGVVGGLHRLRRAPEQPGGCRRRGALDGGEHRGQGGPLRRHHHRPVRGGLDQHLDRLGGRLLRLVHPDGRLRPADRDDAGRGDPRWCGQWALHDPHLRHHRRVHRRVDDRANTRVPGQEDPGQGGEAGRSRRAGDAHHRAHLHCDRRLDPRRAGRPTQCGPTRVHRDPLRAHLPGQQQRLGLRRD